MDQMVKPNFTLLEALNMVQSHFNLSGVIKELPSYEDQNFYIKINDGKEFVLKIANSEESKEIIEFQNATINYLSQFPNVKVPKIILSKNNEEFSLYSENEDKKYIIRVISYISGTLYADYNQKNSVILNFVGQKLGSFTKNLQNFSHRTAYRKFGWDLANASTLIGEKIIHISDLRKKKVIAKFQKMFESQVIPELAELRSSVIHNDWNIHNIIINKNLNSSDFELGIIDFGDTIFGKTIFELAIAIAYLMLDQEDPLLSAFHVVKGYFEKFSLTNLELKVLFPLICARLCMSVCSSAYQIKIEPENDYLTINEKQAWDLLFKLEKYPLQFAYQTFFDACHPGLSKEESLDLRNQYIGPNLSISYQNPLKIVRGFMQYLYDDEGKRYLDCVTNIPHVGHSNPEIVEVINRQASVLNTNTRYLYDLLVHYSKRLCETLPESLTVCYFVNSGSEANELALRLAYNFTKQRDLIVVKGGYHGNTQGLIDISSYKFDGPRGKGAPSHVHKVPVPDTYRGRYKANDPQAGKKYADYVRETIENLKKEGKKIAGFISESIMGSGGQIVFPKGYLKEVYKYVRDYGGVCIADEVQVGFGRIGTHFWGFQTQNVNPDIVTLGKPMANGHPMGAVITTREIAESFDDGMEFFSSFGGNPVSCAIGLKVLDIIKNQKLQENALVLGKYLLEGIQELKHKFPVIGDVRGLGLFLGIEFVLDRESQEPEDNFAKKLVELMKDEGILISVDGLLHNVIKIKPPLTFNKENAKTFLDSLEKNIMRLIT
ncbi:MAG: 2,2-dialkylglycine decarboxylase [Candidatus Heimdallarchaeota archaeon LC_3]|nr:MAG: 2,2-dialkylglycine decarboxylase [Candidatus Heimdallarchaeota archaeon LC_3]